MIRSSAMIWLGHQLRLMKAPTQLTQAERDCLAKYAEGRKNLVEIGVMFGASTSLLRSVMHPDGKLTGIDPHRPGRFGVSFEKLVAQNELARVPQKGIVTLKPMLSYEAAADWNEPIDFIFIDGDHSWNGIDRDWKDWSDKIAPNGLVLLHDSRHVDNRNDHDSVRYTTEVILVDPRFEKIDHADTITVLRRLS